MSIRSAINGGLRRFGLRICRVDHTFGLDPLANLAAYYPRRFDCVIDAGANVGLFTREVSRVYPGVRILAFEPISKTFQALKRNIGSLTGVEVFNVALGDQPGTVEVNLQEDWGWNSLSPGANLPRPGLGSEVVSVTTLDTLAGGGLFERVDLLKTDTEGYDLKILRGASGLLESGKVWSVYSEVTFNPNDPSHTNFFELHDLMVTHRFDLVGIYGQTFDPSLEAAGFCNALYRRREPTH